MIKKILFLIFIIVITRLNSNCSVTAGKLTDYLIVPTIIEEQSKKLNYTINVRYPQIDGYKDKDVQKKFNEYAAYRVTKEIDAFKKDMKEWEGRPGMESTYKITDTIFFKSDDLISIRFDGFTYYSGSAHPLTFFFSINYDLRNNSVIELSDIFKDQYLNQLSALCVEDLIKQQKEYMDKPDSSWILEGAGPKEDNFKIFNFNKTYFHITFPVYQVAPYAEGPKDVMINYGKMLSYIKTDGSLGILVNE